MNTSDKGAKSDDPGGRPESDRGPGSGGGPGGGPESDGGPESGGGPGTGSGTLKIITDRSGCEYRIQEAKGGYFPLSHSGFIAHYDNIGRLHEIVLRQDDVLFIGYVKTGTHWVAEMLSMIMRNSTAYLPVSKIRTLFELASIGDINKAPSPRALGTHYFPHNIPLDMLRKLRVIFLTRNPKDCAISRYLHITQVKPKRYAGSFADYIRLFLQGTISYGSWFDFMLQYEELFNQNPEVEALIIHYENLKKDTLSELRRIAAHLGVDRSDEFLVNVASACEINKLKESYTTRDDMLAKDTFSGQSPIFRKGQVGDWKNWFTVADSEMFDQVFAERMAGSKFNFVFQ